MKKKGQFYLIATIIIVGLIIGLAVMFNYSTKNSSFEAEEIAKELRIEGEKVMDYDTMYSTNQFEKFASEYSSYVGEDKEIYFIFVEGASKEAYRYNGGVKEDLTTNLNVAGNNIKFIIREEIYNFDLEEGKNFYFVVAHETGGERYVFSG
jgi:hypothetical protein